MVVTPRFQDVIDNYEFNFTNNQWMTDVNVSGVVIGSHMKCHKVWSYNDQLSGLTDWSFDLTLKKYVDWKNGTKSNPYEFGTVTML